MAGDQLVMINGDSVLGLKHDVIVEKLQNIVKQGLALRLVVARMATKNKVEKEDESASEIDVSYK